MIEIDNIRKLMKVTLEQKKKYEEEIYKLYRKLNSELANSAKHLKAAWPSLRPNLLVVILRDEGYRNHHNQWVDIPFIPGKVDPKTPDIRLKPDSASAKTVFRFAKGSSHEYLSFSAQLFRGMKDKDILEKLDIFNLIYDEAEKMAEKLRHTKNKTPYTMEEYFKTMKRLRVLDFIDNIEIWRGVCGVANYPEDKFRKEIKVEKDRETANQAIRVLKR